MKRLLLLSSIFLLFACHSPAQEPTGTQSISKKDSVSIESDPITYSEFLRDSILHRIQRKKANSSPLFVHILVPLCDNINQGIVPVNSRLGDGQNLKTNLYWGAGYGVKSYFKKMPDWNLIETRLLNDTILERVIFTKTLKDGTPIYLVADAYNGDQMKTCIQTYLASLGGRVQDTLLVDNKEIKIHGNADLIIFNGHNGLMDEYEHPVYSQQDTPSEGIAIACYSFSYFKDHFVSNRSFPVLTTTHLLAPEAYVLHAAINSWGNGESQVQIRNAAAKAYSDKHSCSYKTAQKLFKSGW